MFYVEKQQNFKMLEILPVTFCQTVDPKSDKIRNFSKNF